jgi:hypothetical protein
MENIIRELHAALWYKMEYHHQEWKRRRITDSRERMREEERKIEEIGIREYE